MFVFLYYMSSKMHIYGKVDILADLHNFNRLFKGEDVVLRLRLLMVGAE